MGDAGVLELLKRQRGRMQDLLKQRCLRPGPERCGERRPARSGADDVIGALVGGAGARAMRQRGQHAFDRPGQRLQRGGARRESGRGLQRHERSAAGEPVGCREGRQAPARPIHPASEVNGVLPTDQRCGRVLGQCRCRHSGPRNDVAPLSLAAMVKNWVNAHGLPHKRPRSVLCTVRLSVTNPRIAERRNPAPRAR